MVENWIKLTNLPARGREFSFDDQSMWCALWQEFHLDIQALAPLQATLFIVPQPGGYLVTGFLRGSLQTMCHRCTEDACFELEHRFETFEAHEDAEECLDGEESLLRSTDTGWELNAAALLWEEFVLALPEKILCADTCLGLCPHCGKNRNVESCACSQAASESSLAKALAGVVMKTNLR